MEKRVEISRSVTSPFRQENKDRLFIVNCRRKNVYQQCLWLSQNDMTPLSGSRYYRGNDVFETVSMTIYAQARNWTTVTQASEPGTWTRPELPSMYKMHVLPVCTTQTSAQTDLVDGYLPAAD